MSVTGSIKIHAYPSIEPVRIHMPDGSSHITPQVAPRATTASSSYINAATGLALSPVAICDLLTRMSLTAVPGQTTSDDTLLNVEVPCTRPDILHECDIMEDAAIAYGFNNLPQSLPQTNTVAKPFAVNRLADIIRKECAMAGWIEALPLILCSHDENYAWLRRKDPGGQAVALANPASMEYQVVRTSLLPGMLKTLRENRSMPMPVKVFEVSDVALQDRSLERQARNYRRLCAVYCDRKAGFEVAHGLLDRVMQVLGVPFLQSSASEGKYGYYLRESDEATYLSGRGATVYYRPKPSVEVLKTDSSAQRVELQAEGESQGPLHTIGEKLKAALPGSGADGGAANRDIVIGSLGILHPEVLTNFELARPCSALEIDVEPLL